MLPEERVRHEQALRRAVLAGDEDAWRLLYDESFANLLAYVLWRCGGLRDRADEVVQETWLTANVLRNHFRREIRRSRHIRSLDAEPPAASESAPDDAERIARALAALPEHYEAVLRAKYLEGQSVATIAEARAESPKAVESLLTRARQAFREIYLELE
jgi:RNA polymerase sigma-70 factor (ECF subfamily)